MSTMPCGCDPECGDGYAAEQCQNGCISLKEGRVASREAAGMDVQTPTREYGFGGTAQDTAGNGEQRGFASGATRSTDNGKVDYEGHLSPDVLAIFGDYMNAHRVQRDGKVRASDNWQKGIPIHAYVKSLIRHTIEFWRMWRGSTVYNLDSKRNFTFDEVLNAILFNVMGILFELRRYPGVLNFTAMSRYSREEFEAGRAPFLKGAESFTQGPQEGIDKPLPLAQSAMPSTRDHVRTEKVPASFLKETQLEEGTYRLTIERERY